MVRKAGELRQACILTPKGHRSSAPAFSILMKDLQYLTSQRMGPFGAEDGKVEGM